VPDGVVVPPGWDRTSTYPDWIEGKVLCAHNALTFDAHIWQWHVKRPATFIDSMPLCRAAGLPGGLDQVGQQLLNIGKDPMGKTLIKLLSVAKYANAEWQYPMAVSVAWDMFIKYCCADVDLLAQVFPLVREYAEPAVLRVHQIVNDRGIPVNVDFAAKLILLQEHLKHETGKDFFELSEGTLLPEDARSVKKVLAWLEANGVRPPMANGKPTLNKVELAKMFKEPSAYADGATDDQLSTAIDLLRMRIELAKATGGKAVAALTAQDDGRAYDQHVYYGAHTGRFSARQLQPHSIVRGVPVVNVLELWASPTIELVMAEATRLKCQPSDILATMLRSMIDAGQPITIGDYASIEARVLAWLTQDPSLSIYSDIDADPYLALGSRIFGRPITKQDELERQAAKAGELGCGYGMGWKALIVYAANMKVDLVKNNIDPKAIVTAYRESHPAIAASWRTMEQTAMAVIQDGRSRPCCRCWLYMKNGHLHIQLPSKRNIVYRNARIEQLVPAYAAAFNSTETQSTIVFTHPRGFTASTYGARLIENVTQGTARDCMVTGLINSESRQLCPFMHVHDEIVGLTDKTESFAEAISESPSWAPDLPIVVEVFTAPRYMKAPPAGVKKIRAMGGVCH